MARPERIFALVLIAPAADFTEVLMKPQLSAEAQAALARDGVWRERSEYDPEGYSITRLLLEDGERWAVMPGPLGIAAPVRILQGGQDDAVPWTHAQELVAVIESPDVVFTLIKDGDHRLSRPQDLARLIATVEEVLP